tara:strand:- start:690 stop:1214 length:525 start_codon:yes stop_codon:yes gene_type:complete
MNEVTEEMWKNIKTKIDLWFENHEDWEQENPELMSVRSLVTAGDMKKQKRKALYTAIKTCFSEVKDKPFTTGKKSKMPLSVQAYRDKQLELIRNAYRYIFENSHSLQIFIVKNKRSGGGLFVDAEDYANTMADSARLRMNTAYNAYLRDDKEADYIWDGTDKGLICQIPNKEDV